MIHNRMAWPHIFRRIRSKQHIIKLWLSTAHSEKGVVSESIELAGKHFIKDGMTNVTPNILNRLGRNIYLQESHPLCLVKKRIVEFFYKKFVGRTGNPFFSVHESMDPVVSVEQNFDSLLIPSTHPSRNKSDCFYMNSNFLLRGHATAHQAELIKMGLNNFLIIGDVYRRDEIDSTHYPVFHQVDGVRLSNIQEVFRSDSENLRIFDESLPRTKDNQEGHSLEAVKIMEHELKSTLVQLSLSLFGDDLKYRWVNVYFPFTHPSWELEILWRDKWMEILGCGIMEQKIVNRAGAQDRIGWAFGLGLERIAMMLYDIPDIRLFWSSDSGFLSQFETSDIHKNIKYKPISVFPQCINDISFWIPDKFAPNDFYDLARDIGGDIIEQIKLIDEFTHPKSKRNSHCYRIVYRHMEKTLKQEEVNVIHHKIENAVTQELGVEVR